MYVDKRLDGVQAVQTLSRLNRMIPGKDAPFVLDNLSPIVDRRVDGPAAVSLPRLFASLAE